MLVLSRRENQSIVFPSLDIRVDVIRVAGKVVRIGVEAPREVRVLRGELTESPAQPETPAQPSGGDSPLPGKDSPLPGKADATGERGPLAAPGQAAGDEGYEKLRRHELRNRLNKSMLGLQVLQLRLEQESIRGVEQTIAQILESLEAISQELSSAENRPATGGAPQAAGPAADASASASPSGRRALIVDDSRNEAELMGQLLELNGYQVEIVGNGREALAWLRTNPHPDIVLMDMNMPEMGGAEAIRAIREDRVFDSLRVFGVSGLEQDESGVQGGVDRWFTKPVRAERLIRAIDQNADSTAV